MKAKKLGVIATDFLPFSKPVDFKKFFLYCDVFVADISILDLSYHNFPDPMIKQGLHRMGQ